MRWKRSLVLLLWLLGILFPMAWLGKLSFRYLQLFNALFSPEWMHWLMHAALYAGLAIFMIWVFDLEIKGRTLGIVALAGLTVGLLQEGLQIFSGVQVLGWNTLFDLGIDLAGNLIGFGLVTLKRKRRKGEMSLRRSAFPDI